MQLAKSSSVPLDDNGNGNSDYDEDNADGNDDDDQHGGHGSPPICEGVEVHREHLILVSADETNNHNYL